MSEPTKKRSTSFAKTVSDLVQKDSALDHVAALSAQFHRAIEPPQPPVEQQKARESDEKTQTHAPVPAMHLRPGGLARYVVDKQIAKEKLTAVQRRALELSKSIKAQTQKTKQRNLTKEFEHER